MAEKIEFEIIQDTREKHPWMFKTAGSVAGTIVRKLDTGDYSIVGLEDKVFIERKASVEEIFVNLGKGWVRFQKELERARAFKYRYLVIECMMRELYRGTRYSKMSGKFVMGRLLHIEREYDIHIVFAGKGSHVTNYIVQLMKNIVEAENKSG